MPQGRYLAVTISICTAYKSALCNLPPPPMSFLSVEPQSRVLLETHSNSILAQFDTRLKIIADRYLAFFKERSINLVRVLHFILTVRSSDDVLRQPSQLSFENSNMPFIFD